MAEAPELHEVYDEGTLDALDRWAPGQGEEPRRGPRGLGEPVPPREAPPAHPPRRRLGPLAGGVLAAALFGVREALEDDGPDAAIVELDPDTGGDEERWVTFLHVPGDPRASRITVRPWLAPSALRRLP